MQTGVLEALLSHTSGLSFCFPRTLRELFEYKLFIEVVIPGNKSEKEGGQ